MANKKFEDSMIKEIVTYANNGMSARRIAAKYSIPVYSVQYIIKYYKDRVADPYFEQRRQKEKEKNELTSKQIILSMYEQGYTKAEIFEKTGIVQLYIDAVLSNVDYMTEEQRQKFFEESGKITVQLVDEFKKSLKIGQKFVTMDDYELDMVTGKCTMKLEVKKKYPFIAEVSRSFTCHLPIPNGDMSSKYTVKRINDTAYYRYCDLYNMRKI